MCLIYSAFADESVVGCSFETAEEAFDFAVKALEGIVRKL